MKKLEKAKTAPPTDCLEDQVWSQVSCNSRAAITSNGQRNCPPNSAAVCVHLMARGMAHCISVPDVMWASCVCECVCVCVCARARACVFCVVCVCARARERERERETEKYHTRVNL